MWIFCDAFLSIVRDRNDVKKLLVRSRIAGDIEKVFGSAKISHTPRADYPFRASIDAGTVARTIAARIEAIEYDNFKNSISESERCSVYSTVWQMMRRAQGVWDT